MSEANAFLTHLLTQPASLDGLVLAAEVHRLSAQLRGQSLSDGECLRA